MTSRPHQYFIFDTIDDIANVTSLPAVGTRFAAAIAKFGFSAFGISGLPPPGEGADPVVLIESCPKEFRDLYIYERFYAVNHIATQARTAWEPFRFSEAPYTRGDSQRHRRFMQALETYEMGQGLIVPIGRPAGIPACVWLAGKNPEIHDDAIRTAQLISLFTASKAHALARSRQGRARPTALTKREREVLQWISVGKTAWEIGEILGIAKRTVDEHVQTASRKLNAANRAQAVVAALREGFIAI